MSSRDWFERLMGFSEDGYASTCSRLVVEGDELVSTVNGRRYGIGALSLPTLAQLRARVNRGGRQRSTVTCLPGDARALHADPAFAGALFQVASQFNLLEMVSPHVTPEQGVAGYAHDATQGPACAMAAGAATIYRNYLVPIDGQTGQTHDRQLDALAPLGDAVSAELRRPVSALWQMRNGYALCTDDGLDAISALLSGADDELRDTLRGHWRSGCTATFKSPTSPANRATTSHKRSVRRCPFRIRTIGAMPAGHRLHGWCCRPPMRRPCSPRRSKPVPAVPTLCC